MNKIKHMMKSLVLLTVMIIGLTACTGGKKVDETVSKEYITKSEEVIGWILADDYNALMEASTEEIKEVIDRETWQTMQKDIKDLGEIGEIKKSIAVEKEGLIVTILQIEFSKKSAAFTISYQEDQVAGLYYKPM